MMPKLRGLLMQQQENSLRNVIGVSRGLTNSRGMHKVEVTLEEGREGGRVAREMGGEKLSVGRNVERSGNHEGSFHPIMTGGRN